MEIVCTRSEIDPQYIGIAKPNDMLIVTRFRVDFGNHEEIMTICLPYATLEPIQEKLFDDYQSEKPEVDQSWRPHMENKIKEISVNMKCIIGKTKITGRELLGMQINDVIITDQKVESPVPVTVENLTKFKGYPGVLNNKKAVKIED
jgi:flagellar motor switch protein FliM